MIALVVCPHCAASHGGLVDPACPICRGHGTLALNPTLVTTEGARVLARAVQTHIGDGWSGHPPRLDNYRALVLRSVFTDPTHGPATVGEPDPATPAARAALGRRAVTVLRRLGAIGPARPRRTPEPKPPEPVPLTTTLGPQIDVRDLPANAAEVAAKERRVGILERQLAAAQELLDAARARHVPLPDDVPDLTTRRHQPRRPRRT